MLIKKACLVRAQMILKVLWQPYVPRNKTPFAQNQPYGSTKILGFFHEIFLSSAPALAACERSKLAITQRKINKLEKFLLYMKDIHQLKLFDEIFFYCVNNGYTSLF